MLAQGYMRSVTLGRHITHIIHGRGLVHGTAQNGFGRIRSNAGHGLPLAALGMIFAILSLRMAVLLFNSMDHYFIHIPKNAGTSAVRATQFKEPSHKNYSEVKRGIATDLFLWSIVRNPYDRAASMYYFMKNNIIENAPVRVRYNHPIMKAADVNDYWEHYFTHRDRDQLNYFRPQLRYLSDEDGGVAVSDRFDLLIRYEHLNEGWGVLQKRFSFPNLAHANKTPIRTGARWQDELTQESIAKIGEFYAEDFEALGYDRL